MPEFKNIELREQILADINDLVTANKNNNITGIIAYMGYAKLLEIKYSQPEKYAEIEASGLIDYMKQGKLNPQILVQLNKNSTLSKELLDDMIKVKNGEPVVQSFTENTQLNEVFVKTKVGDAVEVGNKMFINDGTKMIEWQMTKEKYLDLFQPVLRFANMQGALGDCYMNTPLLQSIINPVARVEFYQSFRQEGNDIIVTVKAYENYDGSSTFENGEIVLDNRNKHLDGCKGMQMYERAYAKAALRDEAHDPYPVISREQDLGSLMLRIKNGRSHDVYAEMYGLKNLGAVKVFPENISGCSAMNIIGHASLDKKIQMLEIYLKRYINNEKCLFSFGTIEKAAGAESTLDSEYNIVSSHVYSFSGYNPETKMVSIINPHSASTVTEVPINVLAKYINVLYLAGLK